MSILQSIKRLFGVSPINIGELNRRATQQLEPAVPLARPIDPLADIDPTDEYERVRRLLEAGEPIVFVTGHAGTGKSTLIRYLRSVLPLRMAVVAPTGVAALNADGVTVHSFFRLPPRIAEPKDIKRLDRKLIEKLQLLIIDELSMVRCDLMDSIDRSLRKNRGSQQPFGGVQLLMVGDLFQLPPVAPEHEWHVLREKGYVKSYFFTAFSLQKGELRAVELTHHFRQKDGVFIDLLNKVRVAGDIDRTIAELNSRCLRRHDARTAITLTCTNSVADTINRDELHGLPHPEYSFEGRIEGEFRIEQDKLPSPFDLRLKLGAHVMFTKNDEQRRWVNGTLGIVHQIDAKSIRVQLVHKSPGMVCDVLPVTWETYKYAYDPKADRIVAHKVGEYTQYPLMLAWAVTIHKSQGKTLENVHIDLGEGTFAPGQLYVALSRTRSIDGISLARPIRKSDVKCDPVIKRFYVALTNQEMGCASRTPARGRRVASPVDSDDNAFSFTRLALFEKCPRAYEFKYVLEEEESFSSVERHMGGAVHAALQFAYKHRNGTQPPGLRSVLRAYAEAWNSDSLQSVKVVKAGPTVHHYYDEGATMISSYYDRVLRSDPSHTIELEKHFHLPIDGRIVYTGVIDRLSKWPTGRLRITDYKTGKRIQDPGVDLQMTSYALWVFEHYHVEEVDLCYEDLRNGLPLMASMHRARVPTVRARILTEINAILAEEDFEPKPSVLCMWCGFNHICEDAQVFPITVGGGRLEGEDDGGDICPECGAELEERQGRYGTFIGCTEFPDCRYTREDW